MIPFCWLVGGGDQERTKDVELTFAAIKSSRGALGAEQKVFSVIFYLSQCYSRDLQYNLPVSFVCTVRGMLNGPLPALVIAAIVKLYVVNGLSDCMVMLVVVEGA